jgi:hypothetical protein
MLQENGKFNEYIKILKISTWNLEIKSTLCEIKNFTQSLSSWLDQIKNRSSGLIQ